MTANYSKYARALLLAGLASFAHAEALRGVDADREEARIEREFKRAPIADAYLTALTDRITAAAPTPLETRVRIRAVQSHLPFAFCMGNGAMFVSTGLLARLENDSQVAALIAPEITSTFAPNRALQAEFDEKNGRHTGAKLLAVIATAGIAAFPIVNSENKAYAAQADALVIDNDATAASWLRRAGFDPAQGPAATKRLQDELAAEKYFGTGRLSSSDSLTRRGEQLTRALATMPAEAAPTPRVPDDAEKLRKIAKQLSIELAYEHLDSSRHDGFEAVITRVEREHGTDVRTACLRAQHLRKLPTSSVVMTTVIEAQEKCAAAPDSNPANLRELAFLYRDYGNAEAALRNFEAYLKKAPGAVDAPIMKMYIEELRHAKP